MGISQSIIGDWLSLISPLGRKLIVATLVGDLEVHFTHGKDIGLADPASIASEIHIVLSN